MPLFAIEDATIMGIVTAVLAFLSAMITLYINRVVGRVKTRQGEISDRQDKLDNELGSDTTTPTGK